MGTRDQYRSIAQQIANEEFRDNPALAAIYMAMLKQESADFDPEVVEGRRRSSAGATGIAQLMPAHWKAVNPLDPTAAARYGARYLKENIATFGGDIAKGVAAYNAGPGNVQTAVKQGGSNWVRFLPDETKLYLQITKPSGTASAPAQAATQSQQQQSGYVFPVQGYQGKVDLHWGEHRGAADLFAPQGTPVLAMTGGMVESVSNQGAGGNNLTILGDDGRRYYMAHLSEAPSVKQGQRVQAGQPIGKVGDTGNAKGTGAHLHIGIGPEIQRGVGPAGGSGGDFDATTFLQQVQRGTAAAPTGAGATGAPGAQQGRTAMTTTSGVDTTFLAEQAQEAQRQVQWARWRIGEIQKAHAGGRTILPDKAQDEKEMERLQERIDEESIRYADTLALIQDAQKIQQAGAVSTEPDLSGQAAMQNARTNSLNTMFGMIDTVYDNNLALNNFFKDLLIAANDDKYKEVQSRLQKGELDLSGALAELTAWDKEQSAQIAWSNQALARAGFIDETRRKNALMFLPDGTDYQPGFEPSGALAQVSRNLGLNPLVLKVTKVDAAQFDPLRQLGEAETSVGPRPDFDESGITAVVAANKNIPSYQGQPITAQAVQEQAAASGMTQDFESILKQLEEADPLAPVEPPADAGATVPSSTPPSVEPVPAPAATDTFQQRQPNQIPGTTQFQGASAPQQPPAPRGPDPQTGPEGVGPTQLATPAPLPQPTPTPVPPPVTQPVGPTAPQPGPRPAAQAPGTISVADLLNLFQRGRKKGEQVA